MDIGINHQVCNAIEIAHGLDTWDTLTSKKCSVFVVVIEAKISVVVIVEIINS